MTQRKHGIRNYLYARYSNYAYVLCFYDNYILILPTPKLLFAYGEQRELKQKIVKLLQIDHWQRITIAVNNQAVQILRNRQQPVFVLL